MTAGPIERNRNSLNRPVACCASTEMMASARKETATALFTALKTFPRGELGLTGPSCRLRGVDEGAVLLPHHAVLHDVDDVRQRDDVEERIAVDNDDVGELAGFDRADLPRLAVDARVDPGQRGDDA